MDIVAERFERGDIENSYFISERSASPSRNNWSSEARNAASVLPGTGRRSDQGVGAGLNSRPTESPAARSGFRTFVRAIASTAG